ncbi:2-C-methyl-D-erythritol 2,4-cyclodiphosphate synthase [Isoalcanivorax beigongshangi]|uniref:2-C-methyl-D-erythritol 2,4-cyclodiphosphate synthase n=1 Tax=Isoalcanivorax beigongshangi TaxID=3238810 RepID=A0ABV4AFS5_9GAMM
MTAIRIGQGFDVHAFEDGDHVMLAGVRIDHSRGLRAHSDGDVVLHAVSDALLGALALGDIGHFFPDTDPTWKGADSAVLLAEVYRHVQQAGWQLGNLDLTVIAERPKLAPHVPAMRARLAEILGCDVGAVSVKASTAEKLGALGRQEGIAVHAVVLVQRS